MVVRRHPGAPGAGGGDGAAWFARLGVDMTELRVRTRGDASVAAAVAAAGAAGLVYLAGGDPGRTVQLLAGTPVVGGDRRRVATGCRPGRLVRGSDGTVPLDARP